MKGIPLAALSLVGLLTSSLAVAGTDTEGFYVGGTLGNANFSIGDFDESAISFGAYGGYQFNENFALEGTLFTTADFADYGGLYATSLTFAPKASINVNETFSVFAKLGVASTGMRSEEEGQNFDASGFGWIWGVGVNAAITEHLHIRVSYDYIDTELEFDEFDETIDSELSNLTLGLHYQF